ncbi:MAG: hypothetical protein KDA68_17760 [Planctomycetaceae bacterium]|nr:hypothetical protein [Planctomycetaceae bacterium]
MTSDSSQLSAYMDREIVLDLQSSYVILGTLIGEDHRYLFLADADVHDLRDTKTTRELYIVDSRRHGIRTNRKRVLVRKDEIVGLSALEDVEI